MSILGEIHAHLVNALVAEAVAVAASTTAASSATTVVVAARATIAVIAVVATAVLLLRLAVESPFLLAVVSLGGLCAGLVGLSLCASLDLGGALSLALCGVSYSRTSHIGVGHYCNLFSWSRVAT